MSKEPTPEERIARYEETIAICNDLRTVYEQQKHTEKPTKRFATALVKMGYHANFYIEFSMMHLYVSKPETPYNDRLYLVWSAIDNGVNIGWWAGLAREIQRVDTADYLERVKAERIHDLTFDTLDQEIAELQAKIEALRNRADTIIKAMPIPVSATLRKDSFFWSNPSYVARDRFPHIWGPTK